MDCPNFKASPTLIELSYCITLHNFYSSKKKLNYTISIKHSRKNQGKSHQQFDEMENKSNWN